MKPCIITFAKHTCCVLQILNECDLVFLYLYYRVYYLYTILIPTSIIINPPFETLDLSQKSLIPYVPSLIGSREEREAVERAMSFGSKKVDLEKLYESGVRDCVFKYEGDCHGNGDIDVKVTVINNSTETRTIKLKIKSAAMYYTGTVGENLTTSEETIKLDPGQG